MTIDTSALDMLNGTSGRSAKFPEIGTVVKGTVISAVQEQQTAFGTNEPLFWDDGKPRMQLVVTLATDDRDPDDADDDGQRRLYAKGQMLNAIRAAIKGKKFDVGGTLAVKYHADGEAKRGLNPPKEYTAQYAEPAPVTADLDSLI